MELDDGCLDCLDLADALRKHVKMVNEARKYITDAHAGEVRDITPLQALQEQAQYYEDILDDQDEAIGGLEYRLEKLEKYHNQILDYKQKLEGEIQTLAEYILKISPDGIPEEMSTCKIAMMIIEFMREGDESTKRKEFKIPMYGLLSQHASR